MITTADRLADRYLLGELLGQGGMGAVYRAQDERLGREVAVKVLAGVTEAHGARLRQEAQVLARLDHPALVRILDADEYDGQPFIVMDLVEGETLRHRLADGALDEATTRSMAIQVAEGLVHAHDGTGPAPRGPGDPCRAPPAVARPADADDGDRSCRSPRARRGGRVPVGRARAAPRHR